jgi:glycosyltransferase involved in cell wall biosynthesis
MGEGKRRPLYMMPLVSAVMPTRGRMQFAAQAVQFFLGQTYQNKELVILDDFDDPSFPDGIEHELIRYHRIDYLVGRLNIPQKRNLVNGLTAGQIIFHNDSDDASMPDRMTDQVNRLQESGMAVTGYNGLLFLDSETGAVAKYEGEKHYGAGKNYALGTSLCYLKSWWAAHPFIEAKHIGSDNHFSNTARDAGQLICVDGGQMMVARAHPENTNGTQCAMRKFTQMTRDVLPAGFSL